MLIETESPFMVPAQYRGKRNRPSYLGATMEFIAELREEDLEELSETIYQNSLRFFGIKE
jgi:TatD DNase family protein